MHHVELTGRKQITVTKIFNKDLAMRKAPLHTAMADTVILIEKNVHKDWNECWPD